MSGIALDTLKLAKDVLNRHAGVLEHIRLGDRVTIRDRFNKEHTGKAVMKGPHGWVLNMGGSHGRPDIGTEENIVKVRGKRIGREASIPLSRAYGAVGPDDIVQAKGSKGGGC